MKALILMVVFALVLSTRAFAQGPTTPPQEAARPDPPTTEQLQKQIAALQAQMKAQAQAPPKLTPAEQLAETQKQLAIIFKNVKDQALEPCRSVGGTLLMTLGPDGKVASIGCALK